MEKADIYDYLPDYDYSSGSECSEGEYSGGEYSDYSDYSDSDGE